MTPFAPTCGRHGTRIYYGKNASWRSQCDALMMQCSAGKLWVLHSCGCWFDTHHLPKHYYKVVTVLYNGSVLFQKDNAPVFSKSSRSQSDRGPVGHAGQTSPNPTYGTGLYTSSIGACNISCNTATNCWILSNPLIQTPQEQWTGWKSSVSQKKRA